MVLITEHCLRPLWGYFLVCGVVYHISQICKFQNSKSWWHPLWSPCNSWRTWGAEFLPLVSYSVVSDSFVTLWTIAHQAPLSMKFPRREYWSALPFPSPGDLPDPGIKPMLLHWQSDSLLLRHQGSPKSRMRTSILIISDKSYICNRSKLMISTFE